MTHVPLCSVKGCPHPSDPDYHHCFVCGKQAVDHHHFPSRAQAGKGAKVVAVLCRNHHDKITLHQWREGVYVHPDGSVRYYVQNQKGEEQCERIIEAAPEGQASQIAVVATLPVVKEEIPVLSRAGAPPILELDLSVASDEDLARLFAEADKKQADFFLAKCKIIHAYRMREEPKAGESWLEGAYDLFHVSRRTLYAYSNVWEVCATSCTNIVEEIGPLTDSRSLMQFIGQKKVEDGAVALETAVAYLAEYGEPPTVKALAHKLGEEAKAHVSYATGENEWFTPPEYIEAARAVMGWIDLDPASCEKANEIVQARTFYSAEDDGLTQPWLGRVWMNPPYSQPLVVEFAEKLVDTFNTGDVKEACVLVNNATETAWFQVMLGASSAACFIRGRVKFVDETGNASGAPLQGQAVLYFGSNASLFAKTFSVFGVILRRVGDDG